MEPFFIEPVTVDNFFQLLALLREQRDYHGVPHLGDPQRLLGELLTGNSGIHGFLSYHPNIPQPVACVLYLDFVTQSGRGFYLQDICVTGKYRHGGEGNAALKGAGRRAFHALLEIAGQQESDFIFWEVSSDNDGAIRFYEKMGALPVAQTNFDMSFLKSFARKATNDLTVRTLTRADLEVLPPELSLQAERTIEVPHSDTIAVVRGDEIAALVFANRLYSSFRNEYDLKLGIPLFIAEANHDALLETLLREIPFYMAEKNLTGRLYCGATQEVSPLYNAVYKGLSKKTDALANTGQLFYIGKDAFYRRA